MGSARRIAAFFSAMCCFGAFFLPGVASASRASQGASAVAALEKLPSLAKVPTTLTMGIPARTLLDNAIILASVGIDDHTLDAAISSTGQKLDHDALIASTASAAAHAADATAAHLEGIAAQAGAAYKQLGGAVRNAVLWLYMSGPQQLTISPSAGSSIAYAADYEDSVVSPWTVLQEWRNLLAKERHAAAAAATAQHLADREASKAAQATSGERSQKARLVAQLKAVTAASASAVANDHAALAAQAGKELLSSTALEFKPAHPLPPPIATTEVALAWAFSELGKKYVWGATGPNTFDCSGLTQYVWGKAGVAIPRVAADQYSWTLPVPLSQLLPGDLVFFGRTDIHHVGIYIGDGLMINAPHTGDVVRVSSIWWSDLAGFGRVHTAGVPVASRQPPSAANPAPAVVVASRPPVPSQTKPPPGWKPTPGSSTPFAVYPKDPSKSTPASTSTTTVAPGSSTTTLPGSSTTTSTTTTLPVSTTTLPVSTTTTTTVAPTTTTTLPPIT